MWGGCHADHGVLSGNAGFEVKIVESFTFDDPQAKDVDGTDLTSISRFGWTVQDFLVKLFFLSDEIYTFCRLDRTLV